MATNLYNSAEGGSDGVTVTTGNSGGASGSALTIVTIGTGSLTYTSALSHTGTYCYNLTPGNGSACCLGYYFVGGGVSSYVTTRAYVYFTAYPSAATQLMHYYSDATAVYFTMNPNGTPQIQDYTGTRIDIGTTASPLNTWLRLELTIKPGTGTTDGYIAATLYVGDDTTAPIYNFRTTSANVGTANIISVIIGKVSNTGNWATMYVDDILAQDTTYLGPANTTPVSWLA